MNLLYTTNLRKSTVGRALIVAPAALALIVMLLWFGSLRNPDQVSADDASLSWGCLEVSLAPCGDLSPGNTVDAVNSATSFRTGSECIFTDGIHCAIESDPTTAIQTLKTVQPVDLQSLGVSPIDGGEQENERCLLPGIPCTLESDNPVLGQTVGVQSTLELRTY